MNLDSFPPIRLLYIRIRDRRQGEGVREGKGEEVARGEVIGGVVEPVQKAKCYYIDYSRRLY